MADQTQLSEGKVGGDYADKIWSVFKFSTGLYEINFLHGSGELVTKPPESEYTLCLPPKEKSRQSTVGCADRVRITTKNYNRSIL